MKRILVTGATGFIGRAFCAAAENRGDEVIRVSSRPAADTTIILDLIDFEATRKAVADLAPEIVVHLAWALKPGYFYVDPRNLDWVGASLNLARAAHDAGVARFVCTGTGVEYGAREFRSSEDQTCSPASLYAISKLATFQVLREFLTKSATSFGWARVFFAYGPGEPNEKILSSAILSLLNGKSYTLRSCYSSVDFVHVDDIASALLLIVDQEVSGVWNIASGTATPLGEAIRIVEEILKTSAVDYRQIGNPEHIVGDPSRIQSLGWTQEVAFRSGVERLIDLLQTR